MKNKKAYKKITSIGNLKKLSERDFGDGNWLETFITLNFGCKTSKRFFYNKKYDFWDINHEISDTFVQYSNTKSFIKNEPIIIEAIEKGCLYQY